MSTPAPLADDLIHEILLRLPPYDPGCLVRASLACKPWRRILTDPGFVRRYGEFHRTPPMLGFLQNTLSYGTPYTYTSVAMFVPTSTFRPAAHDPVDMCAIAARHGHVLLHTGPYKGPLSLVVWDPVTGEKWSTPPFPVAALSHRGFNAAVLCAAAAASCDHLDCHGGPFAVAFVGVHRETLRTFSCLYSSEAGEWGKPAWLEGTATIDGRPGVLVGDAVYFTCLLQFTRWILEYDMGRGELSVIEPPLMHRCQTSGTMLTVTTEDGNLGFAGMDRLRLYLWSREAGAWTPRRVIELQMMLLHFRLGQESVRSLIGFADGLGVVFVMTDAGRVFSVELKSGCYRKTFFPTYHNGDPRREPMLIPYMSFYTPGTRK